MCINNVLPLPVAFQNANLFNSSYLKGSNCSFLGTLLLNSFKKIFRFLSNDSFDEKYISR